MIPLKTYIIFFNLVCGIFTFSKKKKKNLIIVIMNTYFIKNSHAIYTMIKNIYIYEYMAIAPIIYSPLTEKFLLEQNNARWGLGSRD